jgi:LysR family transcriptional regulator, regulator for genes of the gallate degradation pathway
MSEALPSLSHIQAYCEVARRGSVSAAARALHRSQPAVTQAVAALERALGAPLFLRSSVGVTPTAAGAIALARCLRLLQQLDEGIGALRRGRVRDRAAPWRSISLTQLQALIAVVQAGGFSAAARVLGQARATVHRATRSLERALDVPLFEQTSFGVGTTRAAAELARCALLALHEIEQARVEVAALGGGDRGRTVIGAMPLARSVLVPRTVLAFMPQHPHHTVCILDGPYDRMLADLRTGAADLLVGALRVPVPGEDIVQEHLFDDALAVAVRRGHPLARRRHGTSSGAGLTRMGRYPWIVARPGTPLRGQFDALFDTDRSAAPASTIECNSMVAARGILLASDCLMLASANQVHHELSTGELKLLPHPLGRRLRAIGLTTRRGWQPTAAQRCLLETLRAQARATTGAAGGLP